MSTSADDLQRALEWAQRNNDQEAVDAVTAEIERQQGLRPERTGALPQAEEPAEPQGALTAEPEPDLIDYTDPEQYALAGQRQTERERVLAQQQHDADLALYRQQREQGFSRDQLQSLQRFMMNEGFGPSMMTYSPQRNQNAVIDPETGEWRWAALSPEQMDEIDERGSTAAGILGALSYGTTRMPGALAENVEAGQDARNSFQKWLVTGANALPAAEQQRIMDRIREHYADSGRLEEYVADPGLVPANRMMEFINENPDNAQVMEGIAGDERWESWREGWLRKLNRMSAVIPYMPVNVFGADEPIGDIMGRGYYEGIEYEEGKAPPAYPGASVDLEDWMREAEQGPGLYEHLVRPMVERRTGQTPGELMTQASEDVRDHFYTDEQELERQMPIFSENVEVNSIADLFNSDLYTDPETKIQNPESLLLMFLENAPEMTANFMLTRGAGGTAARLTAPGRTGVGQTAAAADRARQLAAQRSAMVVGGGAEAATVATHLEAETRNILETVPMETWRENARFQELTQSMDEESARQILINDAAGQSATTAAVITAITGAPMNRFMGQSAAGRLVQSRPGLRRTVGALGEPTTEGLQEVMEMMQTEAAVGTYDPDNPIFDDPNRYFESFAGGALISSPFGIAGALEPSRPIGLPEDAVDAARATANYMEATNERFRYETRITDPEHINNTTPNQRLQELNQLENLQLAEAEAIIEGAPTMMEYLQQQGTATAKVEMRMLNRLLMRANAMKNDIAVARSKRTTAMAMREAEQQVMQDRADLQRRVNDATIRLEDIDAMRQSIEAVQNQEAISNEDAQTLVREGYARQTAEGMVVLPKGKRALKELDRQARGLRGRLESGYTGEERRQPESRMRREMIDSATPEVRETMIYEDSLTGAKNRRAFDERAQDAPAYAAVDVDSLAWVNDNMAHAAGDRLLQAVSDALTKQQGVEVYRVGGDEFVLTGADQDTLETALQAAAADLDQRQIAAGDDVVTPTITWGKGETYTAADDQAIAMKEDRQQRGLVAKRKQKPATLRDKKQQGLFQLDEDMIARSWTRAAAYAERGDTVEILTPQGAVWGVITDISTRRGRPRLGVSVDGRRYVFNPQMNHLISRTTDPADLAWLTGDPEYADPARETLPQVLTDINIGFMYKDDAPYADLGLEYEPDVPDPWWMTDQPYAYSPKVAFTYKLPVATESEMTLANQVVKNMTAGYQNLPPINIVRSMTELEKDAPDIVAQIRAEGGSLSGVRGYMDHVNPSNGIYIFAPNISAIQGDEMFQQGVMETLAHELIGHYGVRGFFGDEAALRSWMHQTVDMFPALADHYARKLGLNKAKPMDKQLLGEEMVAYVAGEVAAGEITLDAKQKSFWTRFLDWMRNWLVTNGWNRYAPFKKVTRPKDFILETKQQFWNDTRIQELLARSQDFVQNGKGFEWRALGGAGQVYMRDGDIFTAGLVNAMQVATYKPTKNEKNQLAKQYGGKENVPDEVPLFPDSATPNNWNQLITRAKKERWMTQRELDMSGFDPKNPDYYLWDKTYNQLREYATNRATGHLDPLWYRSVLPPALVQEMDAIHEAMAKNSMVGPLPKIGERSEYVLGTPPGQSGPTEMVPQFPERPQINRVSAEAMRNRIEEILDQKIDMKKARITKEIMMAHMTSKNVFRVYVEPQGGYSSISYEDAAQRLFGISDPDEIAALNEEQVQMIRSEVQSTQLRGYDIGYDEAQQRWFDYYGRYQEWGEYSPQGSRYTNDYRVQLIKTDGMGTQMGRGKSSHFDSNVMHIRTGVAELSDSETELAEQMSWPNPDMERRLLSLIELQSDWLQSARKSYPNGDAKDRDWFQEKANREMLLMVGNQLGDGIADDLWNLLSDQLTPIANLPSDVRGDRRGSMFDDMRNWAQEERGQTWEDVTDDQRLDIWKTYTQLKLSDMRKPWQDIDLYLTEFKESLPTVRDLSGTLDARTFERLDNVAVRRVANVIQNAVEAGFDLLDSRLQRVGNQAEMVETINDFKNNFAQRLRNLASGSEYNDTQRLPMVAYKLGPMLDELYKIGGLPEQRVAERMSGLTTREQATVRLPKQVIDDLNTAMDSSYSALNLVNEMISPSRVTRHSDFPPDRIMLSAKPAGDAFIDVLVVGSKADVQKAQNLVPTLMRTWVENRAQEKLDSARAADLRSRTQTGLQDPSAPYTQVATYVGMERRDVEVENEYTRRFNIMPYSEWEDANYYRYHDEYITEAFQNMTEENWDAAEDEIVGVSREGTRYRDLLIVDDYGNVVSDRAERMLQEARDSYRTDVIAQDEDLLDKAYKKARQQYEMKGEVYLAEGDLPISWDEDGDAESYVSVRIINRNVGGEYSIEIDGSQVDYNGTIASSEGYLSDEIYYYYERENIVPPPGTLYGPEPPPAPPENVVNPNWDIAAANITETISMMSDETQDMTKVFEEMVRFQKKLGYDFITETDSPIGKDEQWRTIALKYLISDAVRRGLGGVMWNNGLASATRGGMNGIHDNSVESFDRISWTKETIMSRGESQDIYVIHPPNKKPIAVTPQRMALVVGADVAGMISMQAAGKLEIPQVKKAGTEENNDPRDNYLISETDQGTKAVHRRSDSEFIGFAADEDAVIDIIQRDLMSYGFEAIPDRPRPLDAEQIVPIGDELARGVITREMAGGPINMMFGKVGYGNDYSHTYGQPKLASARESYEGILPRLWNKELKKYGVQIRETFVKAQDMLKAVGEEGQPAGKNLTRDDKIAEEHGRIYVAETSGPTHSFIVMSEKKGPLVNDVFTQRAHAERRMNQYIDNEYGSEQEGVKVYYFEINDKMRDAFSGPVAPFHYDPTEDPALKSAAEKVGYRPKSMNQRFKEWRSAMKNEWKQGTLDQFYGLKSALLRADVDDGAYISARLTTSLESMMKGVLYYGHPVWDEGIVQNRGRGLAEILSPIMNDPDTWGLYMAGKRAKGLLMEGYDRLSPEQKAIADEQAEAFDGEVWDLIVDVVRNDRKNPIVEQIIEGGREHLFKADEIDAMAKLGDKFPQFERVARDYAAFNSKILDFAEASGIIDPEGRATWESADYVPFYRVEDDRLAGSGMSPSAGIANQRAPIKRLRGGDARVGDILNNIMTNVTKLVDASVKNNAALESIDALRGTGIVSKKALEWKPALINLKQVEKVLLDRGVIVPDDQEGIHLSDIPSEALEGFQKMFAINAPKGDGVVSVMRNGKREYYYTEDMLLYRSLSSINKKAFGRWMALFRGPKRLLTTWITIDPAFMLANFIRDTGSAFVIGRDKSNIPVISAGEGLLKAFMQDETYQTMVGAGGAFESGYITGGDPTRAKKVMRQAAQDKTFFNTILDTPFKLGRAWLHIGSSIENSNRIAIYQAARRAGKTKKRAVYEAKDLMDFSMGGDWPVIQFLIQTVPFMNARIQGLYRLGRGAVENPVGFTLKGMLVGIAGWALYMAFRDDERYKELEMWDKHTYFHFWIGDSHYRLPKPFEVGAIFNTIPEMFTEAYLSEETDAGKELMRGFAHMVAETFSMNPMPQTVMPMFESAFNYNFFTKRPIVSYYEQRRLPPDQYRYRTSATMRELAAMLPNELDTVSGKIRSPLHLQNLWSGYTGTIGGYMLRGSDWLIERSLDYPLPPSWESRDYPVYGRFVRGDDPPRRTKYETEVYRMLDRTTAIQGSLRYAEKVGDVERLLEVNEEYLPYIRAASTLESVRENIQDINRAIQQIYMNPEMEPDQKREEINLLEEARNNLFREAYQLRPGGALNPDEPVTQGQIIELIDQFGVDDSTAFMRNLEENAPDTLELLEMIRNEMDARGLASLARIGANN